MEGGRLELTLLNILWAPVSLFKKGFPEQRDFSLLVLILIIIPVFMADLSDACLEKIQDTMVENYVLKHGFQMN